ncbi:MAG: SpoIIE family protein phosphatase [Lachnospiraceae bacterium]
MGSVVNLLKTSGVSGYDYEMGLAGERIKKLSEAMEYIAEGYRKRSETLETGSEEDIWNKLLHDARGMLAKQYTELADILMNMADTSPLLKTAEEQTESRLKGALAAKGIKLRQLAIINVKDKGLEVHMVARCSRNPCYLSDEVAAFVSSELGKALMLKEGCRRIFGRDYAYYVFRQKETYKLLTGAVRAAKTAGEPSGDNYSVLTPGLGEAAIVLSDGMGSGKDAYLESAAVIELMERFLRAGFRGDGIVSLINSVLLMGNEAKSYSTLDLCLVNLYDGNLTVAKSGASLTFIKHEDWVETISASGLPLGMLPEVRPEVTKKKLYHGDSVIVLSDGVLDGLPVDEKEKLLQEMIKELPDMTPKDMAGAVLMASLRKRYYEPMDDMTVIVGKLSR